jgi:hypothetical protein
MGRTNIAADRVACLEVELTNLRGRDIDVVGARQIVVVGRAQEPIAVGQNLKDALGKNMAFLFALGLKNLKDQVLLA